MTDRDPDVPEVPDIPEIPDTPEALTSGPGDIAMILTPVPRVRFLVALCALQKVRATVLETSAGPVAVLDDPSPEATAASARAISQFLRAVEFLVVENRAGHVHVHGWKGGAVVRALPPGLALNDAPGVVTSIVTGAQTIDQIAETHADKVHSTHLGRFAAYRELLRESKELKRDQTT